MSDTPRWPPAFEYMVLEAEYGLPCHGLDDKPCETGLPAVARFDLPVGYADLCQRHVATMRRRYNRAIRAYYDAAMNGELSMLRPGAVSVIVGN